MKEFFSALSFIVILQVITWSLTILLDELTGWFGLFIILLVIGLFLYYKTDRNVVLKSQMSILKFNISLFLLWFISLFIDIYILNYHLHSILEIFPNHICSWFCGLEYLVLFFGRCIQFAVAGLYKIIRYVYAKHKKTKNNEIDE